MESEDDGAETKEAHVEIMRSAYEEYAQTNQNQHESQIFLNEKAVEIIKINLLVGSIAASIVTFSPSNVEVQYFIAGSLTLLASILYCVAVYSPTSTYDIGVSESAFQDMKDSGDLETHFEDLAIAYKNMVGEFDDAYKVEAKYFKNGLWLAVATLFLYIFGAGTTLLVSVTEYSSNIYIDLFVILATGVCLFYLKYHHESKIN
jgi:hypothetical protein